MSTYHFLMKDATYITYSANFSRIHTEFHQWERVVTEILNNKINTTVLIKVKRQLRRSKTIHRIKKYSTHFIHAQSIHVIKDVN